MRASEIARAVDGTFEGGADPEITGAAPLDHAGPADLSMLAARRYVDVADATTAAAVLVTAELAPHLRGDLPRIIVRDAHAALAAILPLLYPPAAHATGIHATAIIGTGVVLGADVAVGPYTVVGADAVIGDRAVIAAHVHIGQRCRIGADTYLHPHVTLYDGVVVGARTILHAGVRAGVDGFGYTQREGRHVRVPHVGGCRIGDDVEIGANSCVDRGSIGDTVIGDGCKIDNLVQIGHNVQVGDHCIIVAQTGIAGSTRAGRHVTFGGQSGIGGHLRIGAGATIAARAGVIGDLEPGVTVSGYPARPHKEAMRAYAALFRLPELAQRLRALERAVWGKETPET